MKAKPDTQAARRRDVAEDLRAATATHERYINIMCDARKRGVEMTREQKEGMARAKARFVALLARFKRLTAHYAKPAPRGTSLIPRPIASRP